MGTAEVLAEIQKSKKKSSGKKLTYTGGGTAALLQSIRGGKSETFDSGWTSAVAAPTTMTSPFLIEQEEFKQAMQPKLPPDWISALAAPSNWLPPFLRQQEEVFKQAVQPKSQLVRLQLPYEEVIASMKHPYPVVPMSREEQERMGAVLGKAIIVPQEPSSLETLAFGLTGMMPAAGAAIASIGGKLAARSGVVGKIGKAIAGIGKAGKAADAMPGLAGFGARTAMRAGTGAAEMAAFQQVADLPLLVNDPQMFLQTRPEHTAHAALMGAGFKTVLGAAGEAISLPARRAAAREALIQQAGQAIQPMMRDYQPLPIPEKPGMVIEQIGSRRTRPMPAKSEPVVGSRYTVPDVGEVTVSAVTPKTVRVKTAEGKTRVYTRDKWQGQAVVEPAPVTEPIKPAVDAKESLKRLLETERVPITSMQPGDIFVDIGEGFAYRIDKVNKKTVRAARISRDGSIGESKLISVDRWTSGIGTGTSRKVPRTGYKVTPEQLDVLFGKEPTTKVSVPEVKPVVEPAKPTETPKAKEPWEMTREEFDKIIDRPSGISKREIPDDVWHSLQMDDARTWDIVRQTNKKNPNPKLQWLLDHKHEITTNYSRYYEYSSDIANDMLGPHEYWVDKALREGKRVPDAVVEEFIANVGMLPEKGLHPEIAAKYAPETRPTAPETVPVTQPDAKPVETPKASAPEPAKPATPTKASANVTPNVTGKATPAKETYKRKTPAKGTPEREAIDAEYKALEEAQSARYTKLYELTGQRERTSITSKKRESLDKQIKKLEQEIKLNNEPTRQAALKRREAELEDIIESGDAAQVLSAKLELQRKASGKDDGFYFSDAEIAQFEPIIRAEMKKQGIADKPYADKMITDVANALRFAKPENTLAKTVEHFGRRYEVKTYGEAALAEIREKYGELHGKHTRAIEAEIENASRDSIAKIDEALAGAKEAHKNRMAERQRIEEQESAEIAERSKSLQPTSKLRPRPTYWYGNEAQPGRFVTDGKMLIDTSAPGVRTRPWMQKQAINSSNYAQDKIKSLFDKAHKEATVKLTDYGYANDVAYLIGEDGAYRVVNAHKLRLVRDAVEYDSIRGSADVLGVIVFYKGKKPVALLMPLRVETAPKIDVGIVTGKGATTKASAPEPAKPATPTKASANVTRNVTGKAEKPRSNTGLTKTQEEYLAKELESILPKLQEEPKPTTIKVPGDGQFTVSNPEQANYLHTFVSGKPLPGMPKIKVKRTSQPTSKKSKPTHQEMVIKAADEAMQLYGHPWAAAEAFRQHLDMVKANPSVYPKNIEAIMSDAISELEIRGHGKTYYAKNKSGLSDYEYGDYIPSSIAPGLLKSKRWTDKAPVGTIAEARGAAVVRKKALESRKKALERELRSVEREINIESTVLYDPAKDRYVTKPLADDHPLIQKRNELARSIKEVEAEIKGEIAKDATPTPKASAPEAAKPATPTKASAPKTAKPATPTKASAPESAKPATPEITTGQAEPSVTGARKSITEPERAARGKDPVEMQEYKTYSSAYEQGKKAVDSGKVDPRTLAVEVAEKPRVLKPEETGALVYERQRMNNALKEAYAEADRAITAGDKAAYETAKSQIEALLDALDKNDQALKRGGREASAALSAYKMVIKEDYSLTSLLQRKRVKEGRPLTEREQAKIVELHAQLEEATRALDKYRAESAEIIRMMNPESMEYGAANRIVTKQKAMEIEARLKAKLSQVGSSPDVTIVADLAELLIYHLEASARWTGSALRQYLKEKFPNLTDDIIDEAFKKAEADKRLTSAANRSAARTRTPKKMTEAKKLEMAKRRMEADLKRVTEAIEAVEQGKPLPKSSKKIVYDKEAKQLLAELQKARAKLKSLMPKKPLTDTQRLEATKKRLQDQIKQLNEAIAKGEPLKPKRAPVKLDAEASELRFKVHQLKTELDMIVNPAPKEPLASRIIAAHKTLMTMLDLSAALRQGAMLGVGERKAYFKAFKAMFRYAFSEKKFFELHEWIKNHKYAPELYQSGLYIAPDSPHVRLKAREEAFQSRAFHGIPGFGKIVRGGERAYNGFLNYLRAQVFFKYVEAMPDAGLESMTRQAQFINEATGRGTLGGFERSAMALANVFFSPRFVTSRIQVWRHLFSKDPVVRKMAAKNLVGFTGAFLLTLKLAEWAGADVELDPRSSEFGKIRIGKIHIDLSAAMVPHVRYAAQIMTGTRKVGNHIEKINRADVAWRFVQSKFAPTAGFINSVLKGKNFVGEEYTLDNWRGVLFNELTPMAIQDIIEAAREEGWIMGAAIAPIAIFGGSVTTYQAETYEWMGNPKDKAGKEVKRLGLKVNKTSEYYMVDGEKVELTDEQAEKLHRRVGNAVRAAILARMASQSYKQLSDKDKAKALDKAADDARAKVRDKMRSELGLPPKAGSSSPSSINNYIRGQMRNAGP